MYISGTTLTHLEVENQVRSRERLIGGFAPLHANKPAMASSITQS